MTENKIERIKHILLYRTLNLQRVVPCAPREHIYNWNEAIGSVNYTPYNLYTSIVYIILVLYLPVHKSFTYESCV